MRIAIESTETVTLLDGQRCRVWKGCTEAGVPCLLFVRGIQVLEGQQADFAELDELGVLVATVEADALWQAHVADMRPPRWWGP